MGFKGSKVQILSSRPENRNPKGSTGTWVPFLFLSPEEPGLGAGPFPSFRCSCLPAMSRSRIIRDQTSRWSLDYGKSIGLLPAGQTGPRSQIRTTRKAGGLLWPYKGLLPAAPKDAGFHVVQAQCPCRLDYPLKGS